MSSIYIVSLNFKKLQGYVDLTSPFYIISKYFLSLIRLNNKIIDFSEKRLVLFSHNLVQFYNSYIYSVFGEYNRSSDTM